MLFRSPGHVDFTVEVERSLRILDGAVALFCARGGVEPQSETVWRQATKYHVPRIAFVNKMDKDDGNYFRTIEMMNKRLSANAVAMQCPIGAEKNFKGVVDLLTMKAYYNEGKNGEIVAEREIPEELLSEAEELRSALIEKVAEFDDSLMEKFFEGDLSIEAMPKSMLQPIIRKATIDMNITPAFCGTSLGNKGTQLLLDAIVDYLPAPTDVPNVEGCVPGKKEEVITRKSSDSEKFSGLAFKIATDPFIGKLAFFRV